MSFKISETRQFICFVLNTLKIKVMNTSIEFKRITNDINGNPRYVCHYLNLLSNEEEKQIKESGNRELFGWVEIEYKAALKKAKTIGGKKYHNKQYGGGVVFQSYNIHDLEKSILELQNK